jgi:ribonucleoside-diphosphate reductase alpha chain
MPIRSKIQNQGIRNAVILTQAPTGTTSLLAGVSSGIEPVFDFKFVRKDRIGEHVIYHPLYEQWMKENPGREKPHYFVGANDMSPMDHVKVQALIQGYTDSSISKTANAPFEFTVEQVKELYMEAYKLGCKGVTFFRDGSRSAVLTHADDKKEEAKVEMNASVTQDTVVSRPMILRGRTYKMQTPVGEGFITINRDEKDNPFEVFITVGKGGMHTMADAEAIGRLVSLSLKLAHSASNTDPKSVAQKISAQLRGIGGASHIGFGKDRVMSLADAIAKALAEDLAITAEASENKVETVPLNLTESETSIPVENKGTDDVVAVQVPLLSDSAQKTADLCPECGQASFVFEEGCKKCYSCGYSMC